MNVDSIENGPYEKKAKLFNEWEKFTSTDGELIESYYHRFMQLVNDLKRNKHFPKNIASNLKFLNNLQPEWKRHVTIVRQTKNLHEADFTQIYDFLKMNQEEYTGQVAQSQQGFNAWQNGRIQGAQNTGVQSGGNQNGQVVVPGIANQSGTANVVAARAKGTRIGNQARLRNANCILMANLQQASTSGTQHDRAPVYQTDGSAEVHLNDNCYDNKIFNMFTQEEQYTNLLEPIPEPQLVLHNDNHVTSVALSMVHSGGTVETSSAPNEEIRAHRETVYRNLVDQVAQISYDKAYDDMQQKVERLQAQLRDLKGKSSDTPSASNTLDPLNQKLESKIVELEFQVINPSQTPRVDLVPNKQSSASIRTNPITNSQRHVTVKENVSFNTVTASSTRLVDIAKTRRPQPKGNTRNARVPSASKSSEVKKSITVEDHRRTLLLSKNRKTMPSECNNIKLAIQNDKSKIVCDTCKQCLVTTNHDTCLTPSVNVLNSHVNKLCANVPLSANQKRHTTQVWKPKQVGSKERLASKPRLPRLSLKWSPSGRNFDQKRKLVASKGTNFPNDDKACTSNPQEPMRKQFPNSTMFLGKLSKFFLGTVRFENDHITAILGHGDLKWGNITITRVYFIKGLGHNLFSVGQFCDADLEVAFRRNTSFIRDLDGVDLLKGNRSTNLYTINLYDMASASPICLMARATPTKSWLWHQRLSHLNFDTINDLAKNDLVFGLPKFKYAKEHLCPSCEQGKSKKASHPPTPVLNSKQRLHLLHMDLCGLMRVASINGKRYVLVIVDDYSRYTWVYFLRTKDKTPEVIKNFLKKIYVRLQAPVIIVRTDNGTEFKNQVLKEYFDSVGITHETSAPKNPQQNRVVERRNRTLVEAARTMLIFSHASLFIWAEAIATACDTQNQDIGKLGAKGDIGFFIGYSANSVAYRVYNRRTRKIMETMNVTFDELSALAFEQKSSRPRLQNSAPVPTNSLNTPVSSHNVDATSQQHAQQQRNLTPSPTASAADNVSNVRFEGDLFVNPFGTPSTESADHPLEQVIGEPSQPVLTRNQLKTDGDMCIYALTISIMEPKTVKEALTDPAWNESMQEELHQFIRLDVWELVPSPDGIKPLTLKWLFNTKHDEENMVIYNKTRLVVRRYRQEEGIDFE
nr:putative ribonuclease H-like domain-containing protein [Tanacetum cinerariifolium]